VWKCNDRLREKIQFGNWAMGMPTYDGEELLCVFMFEERLNMDWANDSCDLIYSNFICVKYN